MKDINKIKFTNVVGSKSRHFNVASVIEYSGSSYLSNKKHITLYINDIKGIQKGFVDIRIDKETQKHSFSYMSCKPKPQSKIIEMTEKDIKILKHILVKAKLKGIYNA